MLTAFQQKMDVISKAVIVKAMVTLQSAVGAVNECKGLEKLNDCVQGLESALLFSFNKRPLHPDTANLRSKLGCEDAGHTEWLRIERAWRLHYEEWRQPRASEDSEDWRLTPQQVSIVVARRARARATVRRHTPTHLLPLFAHAPSPCRPL
jgi:hypothetical protein